MISFITTPGGESTTSYTDVSAADQFISFFHNPQSVELWNNQLLNRKEVLLIRATRLIDGNWQFPGLPTTTTQALEWPRTGVMATGLRSGRGDELLSDTEIPADITIATALLAVDVAEVELNKTPPEDEDKAVRNLFRNTSDRLAKWGHLRANQSFQIARGVR